MIEKALIYTMNALIKSSELSHTSVNCKARPVVEGEHDKSWNDHGLVIVHENRFEIGRLVTKSKLIMARPPECLKFWWEQSNTI